MVKHIVFWKMKQATPPDTRRQNAEKMKATLESLRGRVPGLLGLEVGIAFNDGDGAYDVALYSEFAGRTELAAYKDHPAHVAVVKTISAWRESRVVVDYEVE